MCQSSERLDLELITRLRRHGGLDEFAERLGDLGVALPGRVLIPECGSRGRNVVLWETHRKQRLASNRPLSDLSHVAFAPSGRFLAVKNTSGDCYVLESPSLAPLLHLGGVEYGEGSALAFADDALLIDGSWNGDLVVRDVNTGAKVVHETQHGHVSQLVFDQARSRFAHDAASDEETYIVVREWPLSDGGQTIVQLPLNSGADALALREDLLAVVEFHRLQIRSVSTGRTVAERTIPTGGTGWDLAWWPNHDRLIVAGGGAFTVYATELAELWSRPEQYACAVAIAKSGGRAVLGSWERSLVCDLA